MTPGKFLRAIWPDQGFYCIAHPFKPAGSSITVYSHHVFATISEAVTHVLEQQHSKDVYFAILSLRDEKVWDPEKTDFKTGLKGAWAVRKQGNMLASKCSFFDLDVGPEAAKYPTQRDALGALVQFLKDTGLPMPMLVSSGGGVHVYWPYVESVPVEEWKPLALHMRQLADHLGLKVDPTRTTDTTSVLRVSETFNWKDRANPREVRVLEERFVPTEWETFKRIVNDAMIRHGVIGKSPPAAYTAPVDTHGLGTQTFNDFGAPPTLDEVAAACNQMKEILRSQGDPKHPHYGQLDNTAWYRGMLGTVKHVEGGDDWCRKLTDLHPRTNADIEAKLIQLTKFAPARCETLRDVLPWKETPCLTCKHFNKVPNPIVAARRTTLAPAPVVTDLAASGATTPPAAPSAATTTSPIPPLPPTATSLPPSSPGSPAAPMLLAPGAAIQAIMIPDPPYPYERLKTGGISVTRTDKDGNTSSSTIYAYDLYPVKRLVNSETKTEQQMWRATLPRSGARDFVIDADVLYDGRKFAASLSNNGIYPERGNLQSLQEYMVAYITQLQRDLDADNQLGHLGWADGYRQFILPDKVLHEDGSVTNSSLTEGARRAAQHITKRGDMKAQIALLDFYKHPNYLANQFAILCFLASPIFHATGNHGVVVNMSGDSGASKSTTLYLGSGIWGDPALWPINGTNRGATANARAQRIITNANLPTPVDEITHLPAREAIDLVMNITQPGHRLRLGTDGAEKATTDNYKSAIMISTANSSLHSLLSTDNAAGTAGSMRVFEMKFIPQNVHTKAEADEFLRQVKANFGHIGEAFMAIVVRHRVAIEKRVQEVMREVDAEGNIQSSERFWSAVVAVVLVAGELAVSMRLCSYDMVALKEWALKVQIPFMRGVVKEEYREPLAVLQDYIAEKQGNIIVIEHSTTIGHNTAGQAVAANTDYAQIKPHGALLGHHDRRAGVLYLLKQGFKDHCNRIGASSTRILDELNAPRVTNQGPRKIITERNIRRTLGAGTDMAKGQAWCFAIDMTHPEMAGHQPVAVAAGGQSTSPPAGHLRAVP